jgi:hypothetical protein
MIKLLVIFLLALVILLCYYGWCIVTGTAVKAVWC